jgi:hypothetical protein
MNNTHNVAHAVAHNVPKLCKSMEPLAREVNPLVAFLLGIFLGPLGILMYFQTRRDFLISLGILIICVIMNVLAPVAWLMFGFYGMHRARASNEERAKRLQSAFVSADPIPAYGHGQRLIAAPGEIPPIIQPPTQMLPPPLPTKEAASTWLAVEGKQLGPFTIEQVISKIQSGTLPANIKFWQQGMAQWQPLDERFAA